MFGEKKLKILNAIKNGFSETADIVDDLVVAMLAPYGTSVSGIEYRINKNRNLREGRKGVDASNRIQRQRIYEFLSRLKKDGIIENDKKLGILKLTKQGLELLEKLRVRNAKSLPSTRYKVTSDDFLKIIAFDVPEKDKRKREWLRRVILQLGFSTVQKSVFVGKAKLPEEFTDDIVKLGLADCLEIFVVSKHGTLRKMNL